MKKEIVIEDKIFNCIFEYFIKATNKNYLFIYCKLKKYLYDTTEYFINAENLKLISQKLKLSFKSVEKLIFYFLENNFFDKNLFEKYKILTCYEWQQEYINYKVYYYKRRNPKANNEIIEKYKKTLIKLDFLLTNEDFEADFIDSENDEIKETFKYENINIEIKEN